PLRFRCMHRGRIEHVSGLGSSEPPWTPGVRLVLTHIVSPVNAFISETLEWEAGNRFAPLDVVHYLRTFELTHDQGRPALSAPANPRVDIRMRLIRPDR